MRAAIVVLFVVAALAGQCLAPDDVEPQPQGVVKEVAGPEALVQSEIKDGRLMVKWVGPEQANAAYIMADGSSRWTLAQVLRQNRLDISIFQIQKLDANWQVPDMLTVQVHNGMLVLSGSYAHQPERNAVLTAHAAALFLQPGGAAVQIRAKTLEELRQQHPEDYAQHVAPMLELLGVPGFAGALADIDVYRVFDAVAADPVVVQRLTKLLVDLDADDAGARDEASAQLAKLGRPGLIAVLRLDRSKLTPEQASRIESYLGAQPTRRADPAKARKDPRYLVDCMEHDDLAVRQAAKAAFEELAGKKVDVDVSEKNAALAGALTTLRRSLRPATLPARP